MLSCAKRRRKSKFTRLSSRRSRFNLRVAFQIQETESIWTLPSMQDYSHTRTICIYIYIYICIVSYHMQYNAVLYSNITISIWYASFMHLQLPKYLSCSKHSWRIFQPLFTHEGLLYQTHQISQVQFQPVRVEAQFLVLNLQLYQFSAYSDLRIFSGVGKSEWFNEQNMSKLQCLWFAQPMVLTYWKSERTIENNPT